MAHRPLARANALPSTAEAVPASVWSAVSHHARVRGDETAFLVASPSGVERRSWSEVCRNVERAAAGLIRSGLRMDQVVLSLLPSDHGYPELDLALSAVGAVVVHVGPDATPEDVTRDTAGVQVRLVVADDASDRARLDGVPLGSAELFALDGGRGWTRLVELGTERLRMDPTIVDRTDAVVDPTHCRPRVMRGHEPVGTVATGALRAGVLDASVVVLAVGDVTDQLIVEARTAQLSTGFALCCVTGSDDVAATARSTGADVLIGSSLSPEVVREWDESGKQTRGRRTSSRRGQVPGRSRSLRGRASSRGLLIVPTSRAAELRPVTDDARLLVEQVASVELDPADLPRPAPQVIGDASLLPRRSRQDPAEDFGLRVGVPPASTSPVPADDSAFILPTMSLISGESVLDQLLLSRAHQARE